MNEEKLNTEADLAADYLEGLLDITDIDGDLELGTKNDRALVSIVAEDPKILEKLVGEDGEVLLALQELARLSVKEQTGDYSSLLLDINGWRDSRVETLREIAQAAVEKLGEEEAVHLDHMNSYERKKIHDIITELGAFSHSEGLYKERHIVVTKEAVEEEKEEPKETPEVEENTTSEE